MGATWQTSRGVSRRTEVHVGTKGRKNVKKPKKQALEKKAQSQKSTGK